MTEKNDNQEIALSEQTAEERIAQAQKEASEAQVKAEKQRERAAKAERKAKRARKGVIPIKVKLIAAAALAAAVAVAVLVGVPMIQNRQNTTTYFTSSDLAGIVNVSKLSTAEYRYNGIADKYNDKGDAEYHVYYESTVSATYDMSAIDFDIDNEAKTITPILPEPIIGDPSIDTTSLDYLPKNPDANLRDVVSICKEDALAEIEEAGGILYTAQQNMKRTVEALLTPLLDASGYTIIWPDEASGENQDASEQNEEEPEPQQSDAQQEESQQEGDSNE